MVYIIDANNLAGQMGLLGRDGFDEELVGLVKKWSETKRCPVFLVFDSLEPMGDKARDGNLVVVRAPRDGYYRTADDKIKELARQYERQGVILVTNDLEMVKELRKDDQKEKFQHKTTDFLTDRISRASGPAKSKDDLSQKTKDKLEDELLDLWK